MKAWFYRYNHNDKSFNKEVCELESSPLKAKDVIIKPQIVGICGSDLSQLAHNLDEVSVGHEWIGTVLSVGDQVSNYRPGDVVTSVANTSCGVCGACQKKDYENCKRPQLLGRGTNSVLSSQITLKDSDLLKIPANVSAKDFALLEVAYIGDCAYHKACGLGLNSKVSKDTKIIIFGAGPIGLFSALAFKLRGYSCLLVEKVKERIDLCHQMGLDCIPFAKVMLDENYLNNFEVVIDCTGDNGGPGAQQVLPMFAKEEASVVIVGKYLATPFKEKLFIKKALKLTWVANHRKKAFMESMEFWKDHISKYTDLVSETFTISQINEAFKVAQARKSMKCLLTLDEET